MPILSGYHSRGYLPHIKMLGAAYFVTFRLEDSLPAEVVVRLKAQRDDSLRRAAEENPNEYDHVRRELFALQAAEVDSALDRHGGAAWLRRPEIAKLIADAVRHFENERYQLCAWCVMPNHVHAVIRPIGSHVLDAILHSWKSFTANQANRVLRRTGQPFWQHESYDHWIRDEADLAHCCAYTEENPVKAGLVTRASDWPWSSAAKT